MTAEFFVGEIVQNCIDLQGVAEKNEYYTLRGTECT